MHPSDISKLQILNDLIAQTIDAIGQRSVGMGQVPNVGRFGASPMTGGFSHSPAQGMTGGWGTPFAAPYDVMNRGMSHTAIDPRLIALQNQIQLQNQLQSQLQGQAFGYGSPFVGGQHGLESGLSHSGMFNGGFNQVSQSPWVSPVSPLGGFSHSSMVPGVSGQVPFGSHPQYAGFAQSPMVSWSIPYGVQAFGNEMSHTGGVPWQSQYGLPIQGPSSLGWETPYTARSLGGGLQHTGFGGWQQPMGQVGYPQSPWFGSPSIDPRWSMMRSPMQVPGGLSHSSIDPRIGMQPFASPVPGMTSMFR